MIREKWMNIRICLQRSSAWISCWLSSVVEAMNDNLSSTWVWVIWPYCYFSITTPDPDLHAHAKIEKYAWRFQQQKSCKYSCLSASCLQNYWYIMASSVIRLAAKLSLFTVLPSLDGRDLHRDEHCSIFVLRRILKIHRNAYAPIQ